MQQFSKETHTQLHSITPPHCKHYTNTLGCITIHTAVLELVNKQSTGNACTAIHTYLYCTYSTYWGEVHCWYSLYIQGRLCHLLLQKVPHINVPIPLDDIEDTGSRGRPRSSRQSKTEVLWLHQCIMLNGRMSTEYTKGPYVHIMN